MSVCNYVDRIGKSLLEDILNELRFEDAARTKPNEVTLNITKVRYRQTLKCSMQDASDRAVTMITLNVSMSVIDLDLDLVEDGLGTHKELTRLRTGTPHQCRRTIPLDRNLVITSGQEIYNRQIAR